jgi:hypothetical protein
MKEAALKGLESTAMPMPRSVQISEVSALSDTGKHSPAFLAAIDNTVVGQRPLVFQGCSFAVDRAGTLVPSGGHELHDRKNLGVVGAIALGEPQGRESDFQLGPAVPTGEPTMVACRSQLESTGWIRCVRTFQWQFNSPLPGRINAAASIDRTEAGD